MTDFTVDRNLPLGREARQLPRRRRSGSTPPSRRSPSASPSSNARWASSCCNRDHRMASPTPSGRQMMVYAEKLIGLRSEMMAEVGDRSAMRGVLRLGVAETIVHTWLPRLVKSVNEIYPNLSLEIEVDITPNLTHAAAGAGDRARLRARTGLGVRACTTACCAIIRSASWRARRSASAPARWRGRIWRGFRSSPSRARPSPTRPCARCSTGPICRRSDCTPSTSLATVIHMANRRPRHCGDPVGDRRERIGRRPPATARRPTCKLPPLTFTASWLASPDAVAHRARRRPRPADLRRASVAVDGASGALNEPDNMTVIRNDAPASRLMRCTLRNDRNGLTTEPSRTNLQIDSARLWGTIHETAQFGATPEGRRAAADAGRRGQAGARLVPQGVRGGRPRGAGRCARLDVRPAQGPRHVEAADRRRLASRHPTDRRQI